MKCESCGSANRDSAKFCESCGETLARACTSCGAKLNPASKFCMECGTPATALSDPSPTKWKPSSTSPSVSSAPQKTPEELILEHALGLEYDNIYVGGLIPQKKLKNVKESYAREMVPDEDEVLLIDDTVFGSAKDGALFTQRAIYGHNPLEKPWRCAYQDLKEVKRKGKAIILNNSCEISLSTVKREAGDKLEAMARALLALTSGESMGDIEPASQPHRQPPNSDSPQMQLYLRAQGTSRFLAAIGYRQATSEGEPIIYGAFFGYAGGGDYESGYFLWNLFTNEGRVLPLDEIEGRDDQSRFEEVMAEIGQFNDDEDPEVLTSDGLHLIRQGEVDGDDIVYMTPEFDGDILSDVSEEWPIFIKFTA